MIDICTDVVKKIDDVYLRMQKDLPELDEKTLRRVSGMAVSTCLNYDIAHARKKYEEYDTRTARIPSKNAQVKLDGNIVMIIDCDYITFLNHEFFDEDQRSIGIQFTIPFSCYQDNFVGKGITGSFGHDMQIETLDVNEEYFCFIVRAEYLPNGNVKVLFKAMKKRGSEK